MKLTVRELVFLALCTAAMFVSQVALSFLPNIELVSLLVIVYTHAFRRKVLYILYVFALLEGLLYGFTILYLLASVWALLYNAGQPEPPVRAENDTTEGIPDES